MYCILTNFKKNCKTKWYLLKTLAYEMQSVQKVYYVLILNVCDFVLNCIGKANTKVSHA